MIFLAMYGDKVTITDGIFISVFAMLIVFLILLIISYMIDLTAIMINRKSSKKKMSETKVDTVKVNDDTVFVISAAIAAYMNTDVKNIKIKKIRRV